MMDNRIFNVNGPLSQPKMLHDALCLAFKQEGCKEAKGWYIDKDKGMILLWSCEKDKGRGVPFPTALGPNEVLPMILKFLDSKEAENINLKGWDKDYNDGDVSTGKGWRVYCEDWGHVGDDNYAIVAITPVFMWYGK